MSRICFRIIRWGVVGVAADKEIDQGVGETRLAMFFSFGYV